MCIATAVHSVHICYEVWKGILQVTSIFIQEAHRITHRIIKCFILDQKTISNIL